ncbi:MAG: GNAT family N-acetyltransferase [Bacteroidetes bacterium]|nr:GNAT family N-acetyltransferase [Bacteroidota bacterium]
MNTALQQELSVISHHSVSIVENLIVYILPAHMKSRFPAIIEAIGMMRKAAFAEKGAGGRSDLDLDPFDEYYHQMFVIKVDTTEMVAGYRFFVHEQGPTFKLDMDRLFNLDNLLGKKGSLPAIELGRSFVVPKYQKHGVVFFSLFSGLGVIVDLFPETKYLFGKITFYPGNEHNGDVLRFMELYHPDKSQAVFSREDVHIKPMIDFTDLSYLKAFRKVKDYMPEILKIYLKLASPEHAVVSGTSPNPEFGEGIMETAFRINFSEITDFWKKRFVYPYAEASRLLDINWTPEDKNVAEG